MSSQTKRIPPQRSRAAALRQAGIGQPPSGDASEQALISAQRALLDSLPDVTWIKDQEGRLTLVNRAFAERYRIDQQAAVGLTDYDIYPPEKAKQLREEDQRVMASRNPLRYESTIDIDGQEHWVEIVKAPVLDPQGRVIGTVGTSRDISARKQAERVSGIARQRLEMALEGSGLVLWDIDLVTDEVHLSEGWAHMLGNPPAETRTNISELMRLVHPDDLPLARMLSLNCLRGNSNDYMMEHRIRNAEGAWIWVLSRGRVTARNADGRALRMSGTNLDITLRKSMEESLRNALEQSDTLLETTPTAIAVVRDGVIGRCNGAMARMFHFNGETACPLSSLFPDAKSWAAAQARIGEAVSRHQTYIDELELKRRDGKRIWVSIAASLVHPGSNEILFALTDVTPTHRLTRQLESAREAADAANKAKSGFLATMSHEIRTPMNGVLGMLELLEFSELNPEQRESVMLARNSAASLLRLIDDILDFSKIEAGQLEIKPEALSLASLATSATNVYQELSARKGLELQSSIDVALSNTIHVGDGLRISQIINNLLSNAIKFTEHGLVRLELQRASGGSSLDMIRIRVTDTGPGIPPEQQARLFRPFVQGESDASRRLGGTGLGLSICRHLAEMMDGSAELKSTPGVGTEVTCTIRLPVADIHLTKQYLEQKLSGGIPAIPRETTRPDAIILVVEDHPVNRMLLQRQVSLLGYTCELAVDGIEALEKIRNRQYDLVLTDCHMPNLDGYQLAREIRALEAASGKTVALPIIACTANALPADAALCMEAGMSDYLPKPITLQSLRGKISRWLQEGQPVPATIATTDSAESAELAAPLDPEALEPYTLGDAKLRLDILNQFDETNQSDLAALSGALASGQTEMVARNAHRIKGAARMIGAEPLANVAQRMEELARCGQFDNAAGLRSELENEARRLASHIHQLAGNSTEIRT